MFEFLRGLLPGQVERRDSFGLASPALAMLFGASPASSGMSVTPQTAMRSTPVRCAVQSIAEAIGQLPVHVYERQADGSRERAADHPAYTLLRDDANDWTPASDFREQITRDALLHGNGFAFINRIDGQPRELIRLDPVSMSVEAEKVTSEPIYRQSGRPQRAFDRRDIIHIKAPSLNGLTGASPVQEAKEAIGLALVMERHAAGLFGNGARPSGVITVPKHLGQPEFERLKASWTSLFSGAGGAGKTAILEDGTKWEALSLSSVDAQFLELWQHAITEIARAFRVPPVLLMEYGRATWGNSEEMGRQFVTFTLMRWIKAWQGELRLKLFTDQERGSYFAEFLLDDLLRADIGKRAEAYAKLIAARVLNPNEVRAMENRPPYAGGDEFVNPNTTSTAGRPAASGEDAK